MAGNDEEEAFLKDVLGELGGNPQLQGLSLKQLFLQTFSQLKQVKDDHDDLKKQIDGM